MWNLAVNDGLSGELEDIYTRYDGLKLKWDIEFGNERAIKEIQDRINKRNT